MDNWCRYTIHPHSTSIKESGVRRYGIGASGIVRRTKVVSIYHFLILLSSSA